MMTVVNKYVVSGTHFDMNFLLLTIQSAVCVAAVYLAKRLGVISFRDWDTNDAKIWFPISALLVTVIYTGSKSLVSSCPSGRLLVSEPGRAGERSGSG
jgi:GDP-mannose transporter